MPQHETNLLNSLLKHDKIKEIIANKNQAWTKRREYSPFKCAAFSSGPTRLAETGQYRFDINREAELQLPDIIHEKVRQFEPADPSDAQFMQTWKKPRNIGVVFSGGPAPGGHNVIAGLFDSAREANPENRVFGFLLGPDGVIEGEGIEITPELVNEYRNMGGFSMIKTGRTKIDTQKKIDFARESCKKLGIDALVIIGGDDSNTNAAFLAQAMLQDKIQVIGVPKTIDGDIQVRDASDQILCAMSFGFHTAARAFAIEISNLCTDADSDVKYWHICKVMGRVASHLALEVALQTHANISLVGEDLADYTDQRRLDKAREEGSLDYNAFGMTLRHLSRVICDGIVRRAAHGKNYGVIVIPEGVLEFINEIQVFIIKLNTIIADYNKTHDIDFHTEFPRLEDKRNHLRKLARDSWQAAGDGQFAVWNMRDDDLFNDIPPFFQEGLLMERDSHGNFQFSQVETDKVIMGLVKDYLKILKDKGVYRIGIKPSYFKKTLERAGLYPDAFGPVLFENYDRDGEYLLRKSSIISLKTLELTLSNSGMIEPDAKIPEAVRKIYDQSVPKFKTQTHFYGYDGRGNNPTRFDCDYTYNLGMTVFSLIANGATGLMAAIKNLEHDRDQWEPLGVPIARLMHLEERQGKLSLVIEKSLVDVNSPSFKAVKALREEWLAARPGADNFRKPGPIDLNDDPDDDRPMTLKLNGIAQTWKEKE